MPDGRANYRQRDDYWSRRSRPLSRATRELLTAAQEDDSFPAADFEGRRDLAIESLRRTLDGAWLLVAAYLAVDLASHRPGESHDFEDKFGAEAHIQFLVTACKHIPPSTAQKVDPGLIDAAYTLLNEIFQLEAGVIFLSAPKNDYLSTMRRHLQMEALLDRFEFYGRHARLIKSHTLDALRGQLDQSLGWNFDDYWAVGDAAAAISSRKRAEVRTALRRSAGGSVDVLDLPDEEVPNLALSWLTHTTSDLASQAMVPEDRVRALLKTLCGTTNAETLAPRETSPFRTRPVVQVAEDVYVIALPHLWPQDALRIVDEITRDDPLLRRAWLRARDDGTVAIVADRLKATFGEAQVLVEAEHVGGSAAGETDVVVLLGDDAVLVECKAHSLTPAGRRGATARLTTKTGELLGKPLEQVEKGRVHLRAGLPLRPKGGSDVVLRPRTDATLLGLIVSFERIDPMFMSSSLVKKGSALPVGLPDFLSLTDMLEWPSAFFYYLSERCAVIELENVSAITEQDFLAMFLEHQRLSDLRAASESNTQVWIDGYGPNLNRHLAVAAAAFSVPPLTHPPIFVLEALRRALYDASPRWTDAVRKVHSVGRHEWRPLKRMLRHSRGGKTKAWTSAEGDLRVAPGRDGSAIVFDDGHWTVEVDTA